jgi:hypothetical protein
MLFDSLGLNRLESLPLLFDKLRAGSLQLERELIPVFLTKRDRHSESNEESS